MATTTKDQFDEIPADLSRVGAHRAPRKRGRGWIRFAWAALITGALIVGGLFGLSLLVPGIAFTLPDLVGEPSASPTDGPAATDGPVIEAAAPTAVDPVSGAALALSVFNGSATDGLQNTAGDALVTAGWADPARANATARDETETVVYYRSAEYEPIALGVLASLGTGRTQLSDAFLGAPVTVVLGEDYATLAGG